MEKLPLQKNAIAKDELIIYAGHIGIANEFVSSTEVHLAEISPTEIPVHLRAIINPVNTAGMAKYFQHLPAKGTTDIDSLASNFIQKVNFIRFTLKKTIYIAPILILCANDNIPKKTLVGYDYGDTYWSTLKISPAYFDANGNAQEVFDLQCHSVYTTYISIHMGT